MNYPAFFIVPQRRRFAEQIVDASSNVAMQHCAKGGDTFKRTLSINFIALNTRNATTAL